MTYLTKTTYLHAHQCRKRFWLGRFAPERGAAFNDVTSETIRQGREVGRAARDYFPQGILIKGHGDIAVRQTQAAIDGRAPAIFEGAFTHDDVLVRCDILVREPGATWTLVEVKSGAHVKDHHLHDLAIQAHVVQAAGLPIGRIEMMLINSKTCVYPDLSNLFRRVDVTELVHELLDDLPATVADMHALLQAQSEPDIAVGRHCNSPYACPFLDYCWDGVPETSIFTIARLSTEKQKQLTDQGIYDMCHIPQDFALTAAQRAYVDFVCTGKPRINRKRIRHELQALTFPLYFFDFETYSPPIPNIPGMRPYQQYPFQYSCHVLYADGRLEHREYLHEESNDPRRAIAEHLLRDLEDCGSVIVYHAQFERGVLRDLAAALPMLAPALERVQARLWDQLILIRRYYHHPRFLNSKSIKRVLPVLVPELGYGDLKVQRGNEAQIVWRQMLETQDPEQRSALAADLRAYCERDTFAMVKIHQVLEALI